MAKPTDAGGFAEAIYEQVDPLTFAEAQLDYPLLKFLGALGQAFQQMDTLAFPGDGTPPWSALVDIDRIPDEGLPYLGQMIGVAVDTGLTFDQQRQQIRDHTSWQRGTPAALTKAIQMFLTGSKTVVITERDTSPYHFGITTYSDETPPDITFADLYADYNTMEAFYLDFASFEDYWLSDLREFIRSVVIANNKPAGLQYTYTVTPGSPGVYKTFEALYLDWNTLQQVYEKYETFNDLYINP